MVIFGAGASYDSFEKAPTTISAPTGTGVFINPSIDAIRLPLSNQLFDQRFGDYYIRFPQCRAIIPSLQRADNIEVELEKLQQATKNYPLGRSQLAAVRFYLGYMIWSCQERWKAGVTKGLSNYDTLLDQIARLPIAENKVLLVTFNYDTMLDEALTSRGVRLLSMSDYLKGNFELVKLHGSIDWVHVVNDLRTTNMTMSDSITEIINRTPQIDIDGDSFEIVPGNPFDRMPGKSFFPALSIPVETKPGYECPRQHVAAMESFLRKVTKLLIVGWRANERRFLEALAKNLETDVDIQIVSGENAGQLVDKIRNAGVKTEHIEASDAGFSNFVSRRGVDKFLLS